MASYQGIGTSEASTNLQQNLQSNAASTGYEHLQQQIPQQHMQSIPQQVSNPPQHHMHAPQQQRADTLQQTCGAPLQVSSLQLPWPSCNVFNNPLALHSCYHSPAMLQGPYVTNTEQAMLQNSPGLLSTVFDIKNGGLLPPNASFIYPAPLESHQLVPYSIASDETFGNKLALQTHLMITPVIDKPTGGQNSEIFLKPGSRIEIRMSHSSSSVDVGMQTEEICSSSSNKNCMTEKDLDQISDCTTVSFFSEESEVSDFCLSDSEVHFGNESYLPYQNKNKLGKRKCSKDPKCIRKSMRINNPTYMAKNKSWRKKEVAIY